MVHLSDKILLFNLNQKSKPVRFDKKISKKGVIQLPGGLLINNNNCIERLELPIDITDPPVWTQVYESSDDIFIMKSISHYGA